MVISHRYRYLFIEMPLTGSYAIRNELCAHYAGEPILEKHSTYPEFVRVASADEIEYFVFGAVRNPLDAMVSSFFKYKTNHKNAFDNAQHALDAHQIDYADIKTYEAIQGMTFSQALMQPAAWRRPYSDMIELSSPDLDFVLRYENLGADFETVLRKLGIEPVRPLPVVNKTAGRNADWASYYEPQIIEEVKTMCGPFMQKWGYEFPDVWGDHTVSQRKQLEFQLVNLMKRTYLIHLRYNDRAYARLLRKLHAALKGVLY